VHGVEVHRETVTEEGHRVATVILTLAGRGDLVALAAEIAQLPGVRAARTGAEDLLDQSVTVSSPIPPGRCTSCCPRCP
jgi:putative Mg2+ transporter-C (MgtC) family protein